MAPTKEPGRNPLDKALRENEGVITRAQALAAGSPRLRSGTGSAPAARGKGCSPASTWP